MKRSSSLTFFIGSLALGVLLVVLLATQAVTIRESLYYRRLDRSISVFVKNLDKGNFQAAAYQFHYLEAQALGGAVKLAESLSRLASETWIISYEPNDISLRC
jgi:hypothetical protein